jgi:signal transduction histidine kinase/CheY-like chemotaxis protein/HPt (histidine-containing phosphotransfer) domain-containing protein
MQKPGILNLERKDWQAVTTLLLALLLVIAAHFLAIDVLKEYEGSSKVLQESYDANELLRNLDHHLVELESAVRSYIIFEDEKFGAAAEGSILNIRHDIVAVRDFFEDSTKDEFLIKLENLVERKINLNKNVLTSYRNSGKVAAAQILSGGEGELIRDSIIAITDSLRQNHQQHMSNYLSQKKKTTRSLRTFSWLSVLAVFLITAFSIFYLIKTSRRRNQAEREKAQKHEELSHALEAAERSNMLKEQFVANMSHEIRTPLNAILGFSSLLQRTDLNGNQKEFAQGIQTSSTNLLAIINDILDFSKIEAGALHIERIPFSVPSLLHSVDNMFRYRADEKQLAFEIKEDKNVPEAILGDPTRLTQILVNLLGNAFKFTNEGGVKLHVGVAKRDSGSATLRFTVTDTGIGIPSNKQDSIFERFGQATSDTTRRYGGAGLGLTISKQLIELQGGSIRVESVEGKGASFIVEIPYQITEAANNASGKPQAEEGHFNKNKVKILIVEDNPMNRRIVELLLDEWHFQHEHAANGKIALDLLRKNVYDLVLMDIQMPEMDGYTTAQATRQELHLDVPIIATTAHAFAGEREKCISYGMNDYISKPIREDELLALINRYVPRSKEKKQKNVAAKTSTQHHIGFNRHYVMELSKGKPEVLQEMAGLFLSQSAKELEQIERSLLSNNFCEAAAAAHSMKSTAAYMGFAASLGELLKKLELAARDKSPDAEEVNSLFEKVKKMREEAVTFLERGI